MLRHWLQEMRASFWFVPAVIVLGAVGLATAVIGVDANVKLRFVEEWPLLLGGGAAGSRGLLTAVASSMITVAGVVAPTATSEIPTASRGATPRP